MKQSNGSRQLHNSFSSDRIDWSKYKNKSYIHFDRPVSIKMLKPNLLDKDWVSKYAFYPLIHFKIRFNKYVVISEAMDGTKGKLKGKKSKVREIYYAAHKDAFIFKYYGDCLNEKYNAYVLNTVDDNVIAYRNNKRGKNNVDFAYTVFDHILKQDHAIIITTDFTKYFDKIDHNTLKNNLKRVLGVQSLSKDWYAVYKNLTKFSYINKEDIMIFLEKKHGKKLNKRLKQRSIKQLLTSKELRDYKGYLHINKNCYGVPQGSSLSAVCSNVHLIDFDARIKSWIKSKNVNSMYRRYCDDLIVVIPTKETNPEICAQYKEELLDIIKEFRSIGLVVNDDKAHTCKWNGDEILDENLFPSKLDYLGFVITGKTIQLREKSLFNFFTRAYRKIKVVNRIQYASKRPGPRRKLYDLYTHLGFNYKERGNFIKYARKAHLKMRKLPVKSLISSQVKRHWNKIHKRLI